MSEHEDTRDCRSQSRQEQTGVLSTIDDGSDDSRAGTDRDC